LRCSNRHTPGGPSRSAPGGGGKETLPAGSDTVPLISNCSLTPWFVSGSRIIHGTVAVVTPPSRPLLPSVCDRCPGAARQRRCPRRRGDAPPVPQAAPPPGPWRRLPPPAARRSPRCVPPAFHLAHRGQRDTAPPKASGMGIPPRIFRMTPANGMGVNGCRDPSVCVGPSRVRAVDPAAPAGPPPGPPSFPPLSPHPSSVTPTGAPDRPTDPCLNTPTALCGYRTAPDAKRVSNDMQRGWGSGAMGGPQVLYPPPRPVPSAAPNAPRLVRYPEPRRAPPATAKGAPGDHPRPAGRGFWGPYRKILN